MKAAASKAKFNDLGLRARSALVLVPAVLVVVWLGGGWFSIFAAGLGVLMAREWVQIAHGGNSQQFALHSVAVIAAVLLGPEAALETILVLTVVSMAVVFMSASVWTVWKFLGVPYVALLPLALVVFRSDGRFGLQAIIWCLLVVWCADVMAYFVGRMIGGPKLAPQLSPKKTWAGLGGAVIGAALASVSISLLAVQTIWPLVILAAILALAEQSGDIFESAFKRSHNVKDSGDIIPGHGGVLDRVDGLIAVVVLAALFGFARNYSSAAAGLFGW